LFKKSLIVFYITALIVVGKKVRFIDISVTFAFAKIPLIIVTLLGFIPISQALCGVMDTTDVINSSPENIRQLIMITLRMSPILIVSILYNLPLLPDKISFIFLYFCCSMF